LIQASDVVSGKLPTTLGGLCVSFGGKNAPITGVFPNQINVQVPDLPPGPATVKVVANCGGSNPLTGNIGAIVVETASPEFYSSNNDVAAVSAAGTITTGSLVEAFGTGWGPTSPSVAPGAVPGAAAPLTTAPGLTLGGIPIPAANISYAGLSPCCAGLYQVDFTIPPGIPKGDQALIITIGGISSPAGAYLTLQ
jgi:uncharacterized protein (TIGR03437 family)